MRHKLLAFLAIPTVLAGATLAQTHPNLERGLSVGKAYQIGDVESVNLYNGILSIAIPLGQKYSAGGDLSYSFVLRYSSNVWNHNPVTFVWDCDPPPQIGTELTVTQTTLQQLENGLNAGIGWSLDFGTLQYSGIASDSWTYVSPDGSTHPFHRTMHEGETEVADYRYTRDGSFMRLVASSFSSGTSCPAAHLDATVEFADGRRQKFSRVDSLGNKDTCRPFSLVSELDRFGNSLTFTYDPVLDRLVIHDSQGRDHFIGFRSLTGFDHPGIAYVDLAAFDDPAAGGLQRARYNFNYDTATIRRSCKHYYDQVWDYCDPQLPPTIPMSFLTGVSQPDGSEWSMLNGTNLGYNLDSAVPCAPGTPRDRPGTINHLRNPVGGTYDWTYATWRNPEGGGACYSGSPTTADVVKDSTGVYDRTLTDPFGASGTGLWQYRHDSWHRADGTVDPSAQESWTTVTSPESDESKHYFRTQFCGAAYEGWDYGLPYTKGRDGTAAEPYVSSEQYDGSATNPTNRRRTSYLRYAKDTLNPSWQPSYLQQSNRRVDFEKTVFADDANHFTSVNYTDYDGLGHYRVITRGGDFGSLNPRTTTTAY